MKTLFTALLATAAVTAIANTAQAVDFGNHLNPAFTDLGVSLLATRNIVGLSQSSAVLIRLTANANVRAECTNSGGNSKPVIAEPQTVAGVQILAKRFIIGGRVRMTVPTFAPPPEIDGAPDCKPNSTETITDLSFTSAKVVVEQPPGTEVLSRTCTFSPATANGIVPATNVVCN